MTQGLRYRLLLGACAGLFVSGCGMPSGTTTSSAQGPGGASSGAPSAAATYCTQSGGAVARAHFPLREMLQRTRLEARIGEARMFPSVHTAVQASRESPA
jgi:hypothetical protein